MSIHPSSGVIRRIPVNTIANGLRDLRKELPNIQTNLLNTADEMDSGGTDLIDSGNTLQAAGTQLGSS